MQAPNGKRFLFKLPEGFSLASLDGIKEGDQVLNTVELSNGRVVFEGYIKGKVYNDESIVIRPLIERYRHHVT